MTRGTGGPTVIAVDPGRAKCGVAAVDREGVLERTICETQDLVRTVEGMLERTGAERVLVGGGTNGRKLAKALRARPEMPDVVLVDEESSSLDARKRYFRENPPRGLRRLIPGGMLAPPEPVDDWAAVVLAERWFESCEEKD